MNVKARQYITCIQNKIEKNTSKLSKRLKRNEKSDKNKK